MVVEEGEDDAVSFTRLDLALPDGRGLLRNANLQLAAGTATLIAGPSGAGKSTLFRALAGIWPFGTGVITVPRAARMLFLPQRPYLLLGTLRENLCYPGRCGDADTSVLRQALADCGLPHLVGRLDDSRNWGLELSGGEQQRLAFCRALIAQPDWLMMDEATSALDVQSEARLLELLRQRLPHTTVVSIGHRPSLEAFHRRHLELRSGPDGGSLQDVTEPAPVAPRSGRSAA